jgi:hypothetical protein
MKVLSGLAWFEKFCWADFVASCAELIMQFILQCNCRMFAKKEMF